MYVLGGGSGEVGNQGETPFLLEGSLVSALNATYRLEREPLVPPRFIEKEE